MHDTPSYLQSLRRESVVQSVINRLTDAIRNRELKPGDRIPPEPELAASLGVARSSVREAIKILTYLGVLESKRAEGTFICSGFSESMIDPMIYGILLDQESSDHLMELREMTETGMMQLAIAKRNEEELKELAELLTEMRRIAGRGGDVVSAFFEIDDAFHDKIAEMGKNPMADKVNRVVRSLTYAMRYQTVSAMFNSGRGEELVDAHQKLYEAIRGGDAANLATTVRESYFEEVLK